MMARPLITTFSALVLLTHLLYVSASPLAEQAPLTDTTTNNLDTNTNTNYNIDTDTDVLTPNTNTNIDTQTSPPSWFTSTLLARRLLALSRTGTASTIFPSPLPPNSHTPPSLAGHSTSQTEYLADCDPYLPSSSSLKSDSEEQQGNPTFLALHVATTFRNTAAGSNISLSLDWWDHINDTSPVWPGFPLSEAGLPRVTLFGYVEPFETPVSETVDSALRKCFLEKHPDAEAWLPGREGSPHSSFWARLRVEQVYWIGGFGGLQRIGWLNVSEWRGITKEGGGGNGGFGDGSGRGWGDVRLPGEKE
ncbi:hypothetical protein AbraIFM66951_011139 [Aspergillus brasiliensis]|uniref:CREG-like beta-barrel domain-containing protein n=1 Tax=Aspergillus brasiliensis TaxID=319629 RepID=A0A9W5YV44_9EURO|nr:hypothetical protein AbraCBS73388_011166 [Aspergillus brasiliensis]GKZ47585.1 hypothetical protein AbraIFM66951_011139 [Aspergillus brasiliensis]